MHNKQLHIEPTLLFRNDEGTSLDPILFVLLKEVYDRKKLTAAAQAVGLSYRHCWNLLNKWSDFFGAPLVILERGKGADLSLLGEKLLWTEQRATARLKPQMANLAAELNEDIQKVLKNTQTYLHMQASHGYAVELLPNSLEDLKLNLQFSSPSEALSALNRGSCDLAGLHIPQGVALPALFDHYRSLLKPKVFKALRLITRQQGLMLRQDGAISISCLQDLTQPDARFINRHKDSGTRALFDQLLDNAGIKGTTINGYNNREFTHSAVAAHVAANMADVGFGVSHAAHQFGLNFIPLCTEDYLLVFHQKSLKTTAVKKLIEQLQQATFREAVGRLQGYKHVCDGQTADFSHWLKH
jgi:molybdate transport repressor ModE-like protein